MLNKLKKIAAVITAVTAIGCVGNVPVKCNIAIETIAANLEHYQYNEWWYSVLSDGTVAIRQYDKKTEIITVPSEINGRKVTEIGDHALMGSTYPLEPTKEIILPPTIRKIGGGAFSYCTKLEKINIPDSVKEIGVRAFIGCSSLKSINLNKVEKMGFGVFEECTGLENIHISGKIKTVPERAFYKCTNLKSLTIDEGVTTIEKEAALNTPSLQKIQIPASVTSIGEHAFCYSCEFHAVNEGGYVGYYEYILNADNLKEYNFVQGSAAEKYGIDNGIIEMFEGELSTENKLPINPVIPEIIMNKGDIDLSGSVDSSDASAVLAEYSAVQTGKKETFTAAQKIAADVNSDGVVDSSDASEILRYYSEASTGKTPAWSFVEKLPSKREYSVNF